LAKKSWLNVPVSPVLLLACQFYCICLEKHSTPIIFFLVLAAGAISNIVKSSLGPLGLDKMLVDDVGVS